MAEPHRGRPGFPGAPPGPASGALPAAGPPSMPTAMPRAARTPSSPPAPASAPTPVALPALEIRADGRHRTVRPGGEFTIGRDERADLQILDPQVSRLHLRLAPTPHGWEAEDRSRNGVFVDGRPHRRLVLPPGTTAIALGSATGPVVEAVVAAPVGAGGPTEDLASQRSARQGHLSAFHRLAPAQQRLRIGRAEDNDVVVDDLLASRHHAELVRSGPGWELVDLGSANGTFINGRRVSRAPFGADDVVGVGHALFHLEGDQLVEHLDSGAIGFRAEGLVVRVPGGRTLLDGVGFALEEKSLLAVVGPSGAGKSTLLRALTGFRPADEGRVEYAGRDLYRDYDELRARIGLVPQDDILHPQLTVRRALRYAARLRFPSDVDASERDRRVDEVITDLGLAEQAGQRIDSLSGGQRKRTSVALELLTRPSLLFLDEPTSGLDPGLDKSVMRTLRGLADDGRTVVVVTHSVANLDVCDRLLLLAPGGRVAFFGPPQEALAHFGQRDFADLFLLLEREPDADWSGRFRSSPAGARYGMPAHPVTPRGGLAPPEPPPRQQSALRQFAILARRYLAVIAADRQYTVFMAVLPLLLSLLAHALPGSSGLSVTRNLGGGSGAPNLLLLVFVIGAALMGAAGSIRELVKEREVYRRERAIGLSRAAYLASKLVVLGVVVALQAVVLGLLGNIGRPAPDSAVVLGSPTLEVVVALVLTALASMTAGLAVSALIDNADRGMPLLVLLSMLQFILSGAMLQIGSSPVLAQLSWLIPARWGFALGSSTLGIPTGPAVARGPYPEVEPLWNHTAGAWLVDLGAAVGLCVVFVVVTAVLLRRLDPKRR